VRVTKPAAAASPGLTTRIGTGPEMRNGQVAH
jgi:hypothetical protein